MTELPWRHAQPTVQLMFVHPSTYLSGTASIISLEQLKVYFFQTVANANTFLCNAFFFFFFAD